MVKYVIILFWIFSNGDPKGSPLVTNYQKTFERSLIRWTNKIKVDLYIFYEKEDFSIDWFSRKRNVQHIHTVDKKLKNEEEYIQECESYVMKNYTQIRIKRLLITMNRELYIDAYSKVSMINYIRKNYENTPAYQVGETLYNIRRKQTEILQKYKSAVNQPQPWNFQDQRNLFVDVHNMYSEIEFMTDTTRRFGEMDKTTTKNLLDSEEETAGMMGRRQARRPSRSMQRAKQVAYAAREKILMALRSDNGNMHKNIFMKNDYNMEDGFSSDFFR